MIPRVETFYRQMRGAWAAPRQLGQKNLAHKKPAEAALEGLRIFAEAHATGLSRKVCAVDKGVRGITMVTDASPWGGGAILWPTWGAYQRRDVPAAYIQMAWDERREKLISGKIGEPGHQADWEALMMIVAMRTWIDETCRGAITVVGDAAGVLGDIVAMRAKSVTVNNLIKELALHLAPFGLEVQGVHIWSERNAVADALSRVAIGGDMPPGLDEAHVQRATPTAPEPRQWPHCFRSAGRQA